MIPKTTLDLTLDYSRFEQTNEAGYFTGMTKKANGKPIFVYEPAAKQVFIPGVAGDFFGVRFPHAYGVYEGLTGRTVGYGTGRGSALTVCKKNFIRCGTKAFDKLAANPEFVCSPRYKRKNI